MNNFIEEVDDENFKAVLRSEKPVLVDFWAQWCGPCRTLAPVVDALAAEYGDKARIVKIDVDKSPAIVDRFRIQAVPTLIFFKDGEEKERIVGAPNRDAIVRAMDAYLGAVAQEEKI
jgi:thioredoxin 1